MELYDKVSYENSRHLTLRYSTSFGISSRFFSAAIQPHIYAIYGLVRVADEIVDTYKGKDVSEQLSGLEAETYRAIHVGFSTNPIVHAFAKTAVHHGIDKQLIEPFFASMRMDLVPHEYSAKDYKKYIHGSAEVVGLMCLRVFVDGNDARYEKLRPGASALGSAYQKVNFLRDMAADYRELGRLYFPGMSFETFGEQEKREIIKDIKKDFKDALPALHELPGSSKKATTISYTYYRELLKKLEETPVEIIKQKRIRVAPKHKLGLLIKTLVGKKHLYE